MAWWRVEGEDDNSAIPLPLRAQSPIDSLPTAFWSPSLQNENPPRHQRGQGRQGKEQGGGSEGERTKAVSNQIEEFVGDHLLSLRVGEHDGDVLHERKRALAWGARQGKEKGRQGEQGLASAMTGSSSSAYSSWASLCWIVSWSWAASGVPMTTVMLLDDMLVCCRSFACRWWSQKAGRACGLLGGYLVRQYLNLCC